MAVEETTSGINIPPPDKAKIKKLWTIALYLFILTVVEFAIAFGMPYTWKGLKIAIFVGMTIVKAFYIVGEFMHLKHEVKILGWSIILPMVFILWLILALVYYEGGAILDVKY